MWLKFIKRRPGTGRLQVLGDYAKTGRARPLRSRAPNAVIHDLRTVTAQWPGLLQTVAPRHSGIDVFLWSRPHRADEIPR